MFLYRPGVKKNRLLTQTWLLIFLVFSFVFSPIAPVFATEKSEAINTGEMIINLDNNLRVILVRQPQYPVVSCQLWYHIGKSGERKHEKGSCYAVKHTLDTQPLVENQNTALRLLKSASEFDSFVSDDFTAFIVNAQASKLADCLKLQSDRFNTVSLRSKWMHKGIHASINKHGARGLASYFKRLRREVRSIALPHCSNNHVLNASHEEHLSASASKVRAFYHQQFLSAPVTLVISGNFDSEKTLGLVQKHFTKSRSTSKNPLSIQENEAQTAERSFTRFINGNSNHILISYKTEKLSNQNIAPYLVLESLLNNKVTGILKHRFIEEDICTSTNAMLELKRNASLFSIYLVSKSTTGPELIVKDADQLFNSLKEVSIDKVSLDRAKKRAILKFYKNRSGPPIAAYQHGFYDAIGLHNKLTTWVNKISKVSDQELNSLCKKLLVKSNRTVGIYKAKDLSLENDGYTTSDLASTVPSEASKASPSNLDAPAGVEQANKQNIDTKTVEKLSKQDQSISTTNNLNNKEWNNCITQSLKLANGITLKVIPIPGSKIVSLSGSIKAGHVFEPKTLRGVSLINTALMNGDSKNISESKSKILQSNNGLEEDDLLSFKNGIEYVTFHSNCLKEDLPTQVKLLSHHIRFPNLNGLSFDEAIEKSRSKVIENYKNPKSKLRSHLLRNLLSSSSTYRPTQLNQQLHLFKKITRENVIDYRRRTINPSSLTIAAVGDITIDELKTSIESAFSDWAVSNENGSQPTSPSLVRNKRQVLKVIVQSPKKSNFESILIGKLFEQTKSSIYPILSLADCALFKHPLSGRMAKYSRSQAPVAIVNSIGNQTLWSVFLNAKERDLERAFSVFKKEVKLLAKHGISQRELSDLKTYLGGESAIEYGGNIFRLSRALIENSIAGGSLKTPLDIVQNINEVKFEELNQFIQSSWNPSNSILVIDVSVTSKSAAKHLNLHK